MRRGNGTDQVDAAVELHEAARGESGDDLMAGHSRFKELLPLDNPVLPRRDSRNHTVCPLTERLNRHKRFNPTPNDLAPLTG
jgi:hypothetical protein